MSQIHFQIYQHLFEITLFCTNHTSKSVNNLRTCCMQPPVLWTDEKLFTVEAVHNTQYDWTWAKNVEQQISFQRQKPASIMVWAGVCGQKTPLIFIEAGIKVNQYIYLSMLKDEVLL